MARRLADEPGMPSDPPIALPYASPTQGVAFPPAVRVAAIVYAVAVILRHTTYWSRAMLLGGRPNVSMILAIAEMATLVVLLVVIVSNRPRVGGVGACAVVLLVITSADFVVDLLSANFHASSVALLTVAWLAASHAQFVAIPIALLVAVRRRT